jgi:glycosyltransferase involved in cell wall biosynthesis
MLRTVPVALITMTSRFSCIHFLREIRAELGGVVSVAVDLCQAMAERGHRMVMMTCDARDAPASWRDDDSLPRIVEVPPSRLTRLRLSKAALDQFAELVADIDVVHLHTPWDLCNFQLAPLLRRAGVPYVVSVHGMLDDWSMRHKSLKKRAFLSLGGQSLFRHATTVHYTAQAEKEQAERWIGSARHSVVQSCPLDLSAFTPKVGPDAAFSAFPAIRRDVRRILFLSRVHPKKGIDLLIRAAAILQGRGFEFQLLIAGPGEASYIESLQLVATEAGVAEKTLFLGMVQGITKRSLYEAADVFVLPTHQENFGLVLAEAMACGTPVVTTRGTDIWHELEAGGARIVDFNPSEIADAIADTLNDEQRRRRIGEQSRDYVNQWLDTDRTAAAYEQMYVDAVERGARSITPAREIPL